MADHATPSPPPPRRDWASRLVGAVGCHATVVLVLGVLLALAGAGLAAFNVEFWADRNDLIDAGIPWNQDFIEWSDRFQSSSDLLVVVDAGADRPGAEALTTELAEALRADPLVERVEFGARAGDVPARAVRLLPMPELQTTVADALEQARFFQATGMRQLLTGLVLWAQGLDPDQVDPETAHGVAGIADRVVHAISPERMPEPPPDAAAEILAASNEWTFLDSPNARFLLIRVSGVPVTGGSHALEASIARIRELIATASASYPDVDAGLTGVDAIEVDETVSIITDATISSILAFIAITALFLAYCRSFLLPALLVITLLVGIGWTFGWLLLSVGHLQLLSVVFVAILLGLGIDFGVHVTMAIRAASDRAPDAERDTLVAMGIARSAPGIVAGGLTTAAAFLALAATSFRGIGELGIIAAGGLVLCMIATFTVLPALLHSTHRRVAWMRSRPVPRWLAIFDVSLERRRPVVWTVTLVVLGGLAVLATFVPLDYDLMRLQPPNLPATRWQNALLSEGDVSAWHAVSITGDLAEAEARTRAFRALPEVGHLGGVAILFPPDEAERLSLVREARARLPAPLPEDAPLPGAGAVAPFRAQAEALASRLAELGADPDVPQESRSRLAEAGARLDEASVTLDTMSPDDALDVLIELEQGYRSDREVVLDFLASMLSDEPILPRDLPTAFRDHFVAGTPGDPLHLIEIHPAPPPPSVARSVLDAPFLHDFVDTLETVDPSVTGTLPQIARSGDLIFRAFAQAGIIAVVAVSILLLATLCHLRDAILCLVPPVAGFLVAMAWITVTGTGLNAANIIAFPLLFGIGVDAGVHMVHRARSFPGDLPTGLTHGTGSAITLTTITTTIGFASLIVADHRGLKSLGIVMTIGLLTTLLVCLIPMPALLFRKAPAT